MNLPPLPQVDPSWDRDAELDPDRTYVIASTPRTGSTLLAAALRATGDLGVPFEYFNPAAMALHRLRLGVPHPHRGPPLDIRWIIRKRVPRPERPPTRESLLDYVSWLTRTRTTNGGTFGCKIHFDHYASLRRRPSVDLLDLLRPRRAILLTRRDRWRQAISLYRAQQTGDWGGLGNRPPAVDTPAFDRVSIERLKARIESSEQGWATALRTTGIDTVSIAYEDLDEDYEGVVSRCIAALGGTPRTIPVRHSRRLADATTEEWMDRLRAEGFR